METAVTSAWSDMGGTRLSVRTTPGMNVRMARKNEFGSGGIIAQVFAIRGRDLLSGLLSATYNFNEANKLVGTAADVILDAVEFLRWR